MVRRVEELFHKVADLSLEARARYFLDHAIDAATQREVEALLAFDSHASKSLEREIGEVAERALARLDPKDIQCGPFKLGNLLGRGGMGAVYLGERVDGEVTQTVAIKLLRPGGDDPELRRRFLAERQILATLSHPQIARLLDAGHREDGQPYLVMEYVKGEPDRRVHREDERAAEADAVPQSLCGRQLSASQPGGASRSEAVEYSGHR